jgi:hypothetical protein
MQTAPGHAKAYRRTINQESGRSDGLILLRRPPRNGSRCRWRYSTADPTCRMA